MTDFDPARQEKLRERDHDDTSTEKLSTMDEDKKIDTENLNIENTTEIKGNSKIERNDMKDYPHGAHLAIIIVALVLSIFLVCIDQVSLFCN
jgi:hypothetical protein